MHLKIGVKTDSGRRRLHNNDAFYINKEKCCFVVADGIGNHEAGKKISQLAVEEMDNFVQGINSEINLQDLERAVKAVNRSVYIETLEDTTYNAGTTLVVVMVQKNRLFIAHVGDSRAYIMGRSGLQRLTNDHSVVFELIKQGRITEEEAATHPKRGDILRALGFETTVEADIKELRYSGEPLLLCSDGLTDMLTDEEIERVLLAKQDPQAACEHLVFNANKAGGLDNITVITVVEEEQ